MCISDDENDSVSVATDKCDADDSTDTLDECDDELNNCEADDKDYKQDDISDSSDKVCADAATVDKFSFVEKKQPVIKIYEYILWMLLSFIPVAGFISVLVTACAAKNSARRNFCAAVTIIKTVLFITGCLVCYFYSVNVINIIVKYALYIF